MISPAIRKAERAGRGRRIKRPTTKAQREELLKLSRQAGLAEPPSPFWSHQAQEVGGSPPTK